MLSILIVDDDIATVEVIQKSTNWEKLGIDQVYVAYHVSGAKKILSDTKIDIIISDIEMPKESGLDLLKWVREEGILAEFLLLTCHESFSYATDAIHHNAAAYLTKPFDMDIMVMTLHKIIDKLIYERSLKKSSEYGLWVEKNLRLMKLDFWTRVLEGDFNDIQHMENELKARHLEIPIHEKYCLVVSKLNNIDSDVERYGKSVFEFILEGFHSELLLGEVENEHVVRINTGNSLTFLSITRGIDKDRMLENCQRLIETCNQYFKGSITCCISNLCEITGLSKLVTELDKLFGYNVGLFGKAFFEDEVILPGDNQEQIMNLETLIEMVEKKEKAQILFYLKNIFNELTALNSLNQHSLYLMQQEAIQVVYGDLLKHGIQATRLFHDALSIKIADQAVESTIDMVRWVNYLLEKTFEYEEEVAKAATIVDKINEFIQEHYMEDITRNEIAGHFFLTPSYLAKMYKRKTGVNIKDYINEYRITKAIELLKAGESNVSDVSGKVGFDNFSYFSTLFKKITGKSPKEYRNT